MVELRKPILIRKVRGAGMAPKLRPGQWVIGTRWFRRLHPGEVVIVQQSDRELVRRIERIEDERLFVVGDNLAGSTDSRQFGWLDRRHVVARVLRPNLAK